MSINIYMVTFLLAATMRTSLDVHVMELNLFTSQVPELSGHGFLIKDLQLKGAGSESSSFQFGGGQTEGL